MKTLHDAGGEDGEHDPPRPRRRRRPAPPERLHRRQDHPPPNWPPSGLRMRPHRPMRALAGALIVVTSVVTALALAKIGDRSDVLLAVSRDVLAGEQIDDADLRGRVDVL